MSRKRRAQGRDVAGAALVVGGLGSLGLWAVLWRSSPSGPQFTGYGAGFWTGWPVLVSGGAVAVGGYLLTQ